MKLNGMELPKEDAEAILKELKEDKSIDDYSKEEIEFIKRCIQTRNKINRRK